MDDTEQKETVEQSVEKSDGFLANWQWLLFAVVVLFFLFFLSAEYRDMFRSLIRHLPPGSSQGQGEDTGEAVESVLPDAMGYQALYEQKVAEVAALREVLFGRKYNENTEIEAEVLKRVPYEGYYTGDVLLNRGTKAGVRVGMIVTNLDRVAIGRIVAVAKSSSFLRLISSPRTTLSVYVPARKLSAIVSVDASSSHSGDLLLELPPPALSVSAIQEKEKEGTKRAENRSEPNFLQAGDVVVTLGASDPANCTHGILVGTVSHLVPVKKTAAGWPLSARLVPGRLDSLRHVRIVVPPALPAFPKPEN